MLFGDIVGEAVPEIKASGMNAPPPIGVGLCYAARSGWGYAHNLEAKSVDQAGDLLLDIATRRYDQRLGHSPCRDHQIVLSPNSGDTGRCLLLVENNGHKRGRVDGDHAGRPSSP